MTQLLGCPHCSARFSLAEWSRTAGCPTCGRRVTFFEASEAGGSAEQGTPPGSAESAGPDATAGPGLDATPGLVGIPVSAAESPRTPAPPPTGERLFMGKPLRWTRGWTVVVAIWVLVAVALLLVRTQMTYLIDYSIEEQAAVDAVPFALMPDGETTYHEALAAATVRLTLAGDLESSAQWYVWSRPWEGRIYVWLEYREDDRGLLVLGWWVEDGRVNADPATDRFLESALDDNALLELPGKLPDFLR